MKLVRYQLNNGKIPFDLWMQNLRDLKAKAKILVRLKRLEAGHFGDTKSVGDGIQELRILEGQGYRVYYGQTTNEIVILLLGGNKSTQTNDIELAKSYWRNYRENS